MEEPCGQGKAAGRSKHTRTWEGEGGGDADVRCSVCIKADCNTDRVNANF